MLPGVSTLDIMRILSEITYRTPWRSAGIAAACWALFLTAGLAKAAPLPLESFANRWLVTPPVVAQGPGGSYQARSMQRFVATGDDAFSIGNILYFKAPKRKNADGSLEAFDADRIFRTVQDGMGSLPARARRQGKAHVFEADWAEALRVLRVYVTDEGDSVAYSVALFRTAYAAEASIESELIQRQLAGVLEERVPWLEKMLKFVDQRLGTAPAYAQSFPSFPKMPTGGGVPGGAIGGKSGCGSGCASADVSCWIASANCDTSDLSKYMGPDSAIGQLNLQTAQGIEQWKQSNAEMQRMHTTLKNFLKPENAFMWAAASAAGATLGAIAASAAVDAIAAGGKAIWEAITGEKEDARILERFKEARETWEKTSSAAADLEKAIDSMLNLKETARGFGIPRSQLVTQLGAAKAGGEAGLRKATADIDAALARGDLACVNDLSHKVAALDDFVAVMSKLRSRMEDPLSDAALCSQLRKNLEKLREAEGQLQIARAKILGGQERWQREWNGQYDEAFADLKRARDNASKVRDRAISAAAGGRDKAMRELKVIRDEAMGACEVERAGIWGKIPIIGAVRTAWAGPCSRDFYSTAEGRNYIRRWREIDAAYDNAKREAAREYDKAVRSRNDVQLHNPTNEAALRAYNHWFDQVRDEQACLNKETACPPGQEGGLVTRFQALAKKAGRIDQVCAQH